MNTPSNVSDTRQQLRDWIAGNARRAVPGGLLDDTPILEQRVITSLQVMELILFVERASGRPVDIRQLRPSSFRSIDDIHKAFFSGAHDEQPAV